MQSNKADMAAIMAVKQVLVFSLLLYSCSSAHISPAISKVKNTVLDLHRKEIAGAHMLLPHESSFMSDKINAQPSLKFNLRQFLDEHKDLRRKGLLHLFQQAEVGYSIPEAQNDVDDVKYNSLVDVKHKSDNDESLNSFNDAEKYNSLNDVHLKSTNDVEVIKLSVETDTAIFTVDESFLSFTVDYELFYLTDPWKLFNISSPRLVTLLSGLSPAIWRIGGSGSSYMYYDAKADHMLPAKLTPNSTIFPKEALTGFVKASVASGNRFLLDLNLQTRQGLQWNPINALHIFDDLIAQGFGANIDFELGNEPEYDQPSKGLQLLTPEQIGNDYLILDRVITSYKEFADSRIVGPDCVGVTKGSLGTEILNKVASIAGDKMRAITFHHYYFKGTTATYKNYIDPNYYSTLAQTIRTAQTAVLTSLHPLLPLWIGETSDSWDSGTPHVSDRYVSGFLWLEKLGLAASMGVELVMRQTFYCGNYGLVGDYLQPNPDYWLSYVYKHLVGRNVLSVVRNGVEFSADTDPVDPLTTRVYAHCTKLSSAGIIPSYPRGSVTIFGLNVSPNISKSLMLSPDWRKAPTDLYLLTPPKGDLLSQQVLLNDQILQLISDTQLPRLSPKTISPQQPFTLPPLTFGFLVVPHAKAKACL